jgi:hypothetical protein
MADAHTYTPSGKFSPLALLYTPLFGLPVGALAAAVYAYVILYLPIVGYVSFLLTMGLGWLTATAVTMALQKGKVRNQGVGTALGLGIGLFTLYFQWVTWIYALVHRNDGELGFLPLLLNPSGLWEAITIVNSKGAWTMHGATPTGGVLWALWAVEAAIILGFPLVAAWGVARAPFCEACRTWCEEKKGLFHTEVADKEEVVSRLAIKDLTWFAALGPARSNDSWLRLDFHECGCRHTATLSAVHVTATVKDGKRELKDSPWLEHVLVGQDVATQAIAIAQRFQQLEPAQPMEAPGSPAVAA